MTTAHEIAAQIKAWNKQDVFELRNLIVELEEAIKAEGENGRRDQYIDLAQLPSAEIPADVNTGYPVWAMDAAGRLLVGADVREVVTLEQYREERGTSASRVTRLESGATVITLGGESYRANGQAYPGVTTAVWYLNAERHGEPVKLKFDSSDLDPSAEADTYPWDDASRYSVVA